MRFKLRKFPSIGTEYLVCNTCGRAQRRPRALATRGRGKRADDRETMRKALALSAGACKFKILVWGPDPNSSNPAAPVRREIRGELERLGHEPIYSEELSISGVPINLQELLQLKRVNLVIDVAASHGSVAEFENYAIAAKERMLAFLDESARGGFTAAGTLLAFKSVGGTYEYFRDDDLRTGAVVLAAIDWVKLKAYVQQHILEMIEGLKNSLV